MTRWEYEMNSELREWEKELAEINGELGEVTFPYKHNVEVEMVSRFDESVWDTLIGIFSMLVSKNRKYGNSALNPARIFSKAGRLEQLYTRVDDKLSRIANQSPDDDEDAVGDLIGYLVLIKIAQQGQNDLH